ncbi:MAG: hypothetical protein IJ779_00020 [Ruminococcus sp.]|nr:hypothetical protein [Ruminococcus sp.]
MRSTKRLTALAAAALLSPLFVSVSGVKAIDPPTDVHLTLESKDIYIDEIPEDRVVSLTVYLENCPPYNTLCFGVVKDPRLSFYTETECFKMHDSVVQAGSATCRRYLDDPDFRFCGTGATGDDLQRVSYENALVVVSFQLPEQVSAGDYFPIELPRTRHGMTVQLSLSQSFDDFYEDFPFTQLNGGGIRILQKDQPPPPPDNGGANAQGGAGQADGGAQPSEGGNAPAAPDSGGGGGAAPAPTEAAVTQTTVVTASETSTSTTSKTTASQTTTTVTTTTITSDTTSTTSTSQTTTAAAVTSGAEEEPEKRNAGGLKTIGIITLAVAAISAVTVLAARLRMNKK